MKLLIFDQREPSEGLSITKINHLLQSAGVKRRRGIKIEKRYIAFALTKEEAQKLTDAYPSPTSIYEVEGLVKYAIGSMPYCMIRDPAEGNSDSITQIPDTTS